MSKQLPYFQFEPAEYLTGSIQFCSLAAQGLFINIKCIYWQRDCDITMDQIRKRFNQPELIEELINENIIKVKSGKVVIDFLDRQLSSVVSWKKKSSNAGIRSARLKKARELGTHTKQEWNTLLDAAKGVCPRCNQPAEVWHKDHVIPIYQGGSDAIENIQPLCERCNLQKGSESIDYFKDKRGLALNKFNQTSTIFEIGFNQTSTIREEDIIEDKIKGNKRMVFKIPQISELLEISPEVTPKIAESFLDHYNSNGWMVGRNKMKDWKASLRNWLRNENKFKSKERTFVP